MTPPFFPGFLTARGDVSPFFLEPTPYLLPLKPPSPFVQFGDSNSSKCSLFKVEAVCLTIFLRGGGSLTSPSPPTTCLSFLPLPMKGSCTDFRSGLPMIPDFFLCVAFLVYDLSLPVSNFLLLKSLLRDPSLSGAKELSFLCAEASSSFKAPFLPLWETSPFPFRQYSSPPPLYPHVLQVAEEVFFDLLPRVPLSLFFDGGHIYSSPPRSRISLQNRRSPSPLPIAKC